MSSRYYTATVAENEDPELRGRLKLTIPGITGPDKPHPDWIRGRIVGAGAAGVALFWIPPVGSVVFVEADRGDVLRWLGSELGSRQVLPDLYRTDYPLRAGLTSPDGSVLFCLAPDLAILEASDIRLGSENASEFVALANLVAAVFSTLKSWLDTHTHLGVTAGPGVTGLPVVLSPSAASTAASKVRAE